MIKVGKAEENLSETNLNKVIALLNQEKPITKKVACEMLGIAYNTTRLGNLIQKHQEMVANRERRRAEKRGTPATEDEIHYTIKEYMTGAPISDICSALFRGPQFVHAILEKFNVPARPKSQDYFKPELIPDEAVRTEFVLQEKVYSARYDSLARVDALVQVSKEGENVYRIYLLDDKWLMNAYQPASELASLEHLIKLGIKL